MQPFGGDGQSPNGAPQQPYQPQQPPYQQPYQQPYQPPYQPPQTGGGFGAAVPPPYEQPIASPVIPYSQTPVYGAQPQPQPPTEEPESKPEPAQPQPKRPVSKWVYIALAGVVLVVAGYLLVQMLSRSESGFAVVQGGVLGTRHAGDALIVRNETLYEQEGVSQIKYLAEEGSAVSRGTPVCNVYTSGFNSKELTTLQKYRTQIKDYLSTLTSTPGSATDLTLTRYDSEVLTRALEVQQLVQGASGDLLNQESLLANALSNRQYYLRQKYPDDQKLSRLFDDENSQLNRIDSWTKQYAATVDGLVSFYSDGYEKSLSLSTYANYDPAQVRRMFSGRLPDEGTAYTRSLVPIYRLVRQGSWAVLMLCSDEDWTPVQGNTYKLRVESFDSTVVDAKVESFTRSGGELLVRLSVQSPVDKIFYTRSCHVLVGEQVSNLRVPTNAIYHAADGSVGVVVVQPDGNYYIPCTIIATDGSTTHIVPESDGLLFEGQTVLLNP